MSARSTIGGPDRVTRVHGDPPLSAQWTGFSRNRAQRARQVSRPAERRGVFTLLLDTISRARRVLVLLPRRRHRLADPRLAAGDPGIRLRLSRRPKSWNPVTEKFGAAGADLRHAGHLAHRHADRRAGRLRHRDLPHRTLPACAAPPDRRRHRTARRHSLDHLRHLGPVRARALPAAARAAGADRRSSATFRC